MRPPGNGRERAAGLPAGLAGAGDGYAWGHPQVCSVASRELLLLGRLMPSPSDPDAEPKTDSDV